MTGRDNFKKYKIAIVLLTKLFGIFGKKINETFLVIFRGVSGKGGILLRYIFLKNIIKKCGDNVAVFEDVYLKNISNLVIGDNVSIHPMCYIDAEGGIDIGNNVSVAHATSILSVNHNYRDRNVPIKYQQMIEDKCVIENNCWIGARSVILAGVTIFTGFEIKRYWSK